MCNAVEKITEAEAEIMKVIWDNNNSATYTHIRTALTQKAEKWESPTINTLVNRLVKKGVLTQEKREVFYYSATVSEMEYMKSKTRNLIRKVYNGNARGLLSALVSYKEISNDDIDYLRELFKKGGELDE